MEKNPCALRVSALNPRNLRFCILHFFAPFALLHLYYPTKR
jgi:hypothetical protein